MTLHVGFYIQRTGDLTQDADIFKGLAYQMLLQDCKAIYFYFPQTNQADSKTSIEVNIGIIAACTPIMKPLVRYIQARISGKDPHGLVRHSSSTKWSWHPHWYSRLWSSRPSLPTAEFQTHRGRATRPTLPLVSSEIGLKEPYGIGARLPPAEVETCDSASLKLPLQGGTNAEDVYNEIPGYRVSDLKRALTKDSKFR